MAASLSSELDKLSIADEEPSPDEIRDIILEAMKEEDIYPEDVPEEEEKPFDIGNNLYQSCRYFTKHGLGQFHCSDKNWSSVLAWCYIDLKEQEICYRYYQKCHSCDKKVWPKFFKEAIENMVYLAVQSFLIRTGRKEKEETDGNSSRHIGGPHDKASCEKCIRRGHRCC